MCWRICSSRVHQGGQWRCTQPCNSKSLCDCLATQFPANLILVIWKPCICNVCCGQPKFFQYSSSHSCCCPKIRAIHTAVVTPVANHAPEGCVLLLLTFCWLLASRCVAFSHEACHHTAPGSAHSCGPLQHSPAQQTDGWQTRLPVALGAGRPDRRVRTQHVCDRQWLTALRQPETTPNRCKMVAQERHRAMFVQVFLSTSSKHSKSTSKGFWQAIWTQDDTKDIDYTTPSQ